MKLKRVEIEGFRAYQKKTDGTFDFTIEGEKPAEFVAIYAPNGFGKSSFYDAVEWALTNNIERYICDQHRRNNELAARGTKLDGIPQYILRNKDITEDETTSVTVITTEREFSRSLKNVRSDSRDIRFTENDTESGSEAFRRILLSQDAIDRFIREVKPEERYELFMEHFGGNAEQVRKELYVLKHENRGILATLDKSRMELEEIIDQSDYEHIFSEFNEIASNLNAHGESVNLVLEDISTLQEHEILATILSRKHQLELDLLSIKSAILALHEKLDKVQDIERNLSRQSDLQAALTRASKGVADSQRYAELLQSHDKVLIEIDEVSKKIQHYRTIHADLPSYRKALDEVISERALRVNLEKRMSLLSSGLGISKLEEATLLKDISKVDEDLLKWSELESSASLIYSQILSHQALLASQQHELSVQRASISLDETHLRRAKFDIETISAIEINRETVISSDLTVLGLAPELVIEITKLSQQVESYDMQEQSLKRTQETLLAQSSIIERLVGLGLESVSITPTQYCPLCQKDHGTDIALKDAILSNTSASKVMQENAEMLKLSSQLKSETTKRIDVILNNISSLKGERLTSLQSESIRLSTKIDNLTRSCAILETSISNITATIDSYNQTVFNLDSEALAARIAKEKTELLSLQTSLKHKLQKQQEKLSSTQTELDTVNNLIMSSESKESAIIGLPTFESVDTFLKNNTMKVEEAPYFFEDNFERYFNINRDAHSNAEFIVEECKKLQAEMAEEGNWIAFPLLEKRRDELLTEIKTLEEISTPYLRDLHSLIDNFTIDGNESLRSTIENRVNTHKKNEKNLEDNINKYELLEIQLKALAPFVANIGRREKLAEVQFKLIKHNRLDQKLNDEMNEVTKFLDKQIRAYFYTNLINNIYSKIDPHPSFKNVEFIPIFGANEKPLLNIVISDANGNTISPNLYFSAAQLNILSLSVFLARALHTQHEGKPLDVILIDDPIHSMDSINILSMIDLLRNISTQFNKQIIISTHDENFFSLLKKKIPEQTFHSKFITFESFGVVSQ